MQCRIVYYCQNEDMFEMFKWKILERLVPYDTLAGLTSMKSDNFAQIKEGKSPAPFGFDCFIKVNEFFNWLKEQPYHDNTIKKEVEYLEQSIAAYIAPGKADLDEFEKVTKPLMEYLMKNHHPHVTVIITATHAELVEGQMMAQNK